MSSPLQRQLVTLAAAIQSPPSPTLTTNGPALAPSAAAATTTASTPLYLSPGPKPTPATMTKPRSASGSRNDLFNTSWTPEVPPPRPLDLDLLPTPPSLHSPSSPYSTYGDDAPARPIPPREVRTTPPSPVQVSSPAFPQTPTHAHTAQMLDLSSSPDSSSSARIAPAGVMSALGPGPGTGPIAIVTATTRNERASPKTSSFFDMSAAADTPPPAPRLPSSLASFSPSPLSLSRASSIRTRPPVPTLGTSALAGPSSGQTLLVGSLALSSDDENTLSPLHQSPSLPPTTFPSWQPPRPPTSDDIALRLIPDPTYLLGEGRYASVYLASYRRERVAQGQSQGEGPKGLGRGHELRRRVASTPGPSISNSLGSGSLTPWMLCAAKRLAADRESQTLGLREAFFLNRLGSSSPSSTAATTAATRGSSPLRSRTDADDTGRRSSGSHADDGDGDDGEGHERPARERPLPGRVYIVKLIAVKEVAEDVPRSHVRSVSDAESASGRTRQRSSTIYSSVGRHVEHTGNSSINVGPGSGSSLGTGKGLGAGTFSSILGVGHPPTPPGASRLVLVLEHAPLGTLDRLLRTSPEIVGAQLWGRWAREAAEALEWVHSRGVVHADVKPGNLLLTTDLHLRLSDFGSSLLVHPSHPPTDGVGLGTLPFSPPELVDPNAPFSFPVDIFALGATLYQCITGREPYRSSRTVEMVHHVRKGGLWAWEERERLARIGTPAPISTAGSPYPSAWRDDSVPIGGSTIRRSGSLRVPLAHAEAAVNHGPGHGGSLGRPRLTRMASAESVKASDDVVTGPNSSESPAGVKLWANWIKIGSRGGDPIDRLLRDEADGDDAASSSSPPTTPTHSVSGVMGSGVSRRSSLRSPITSRDDPALLSSVSAALSMGVPYADGAPAMFFLGAGLSPCAGSATDSSGGTLGSGGGGGGGAEWGRGERERVPDDVRDLLRAMLDAGPENRPTASEVVRAWDEMGVGEHARDR